tara:strand:- start:100 stop:468 length:369 start_codon:yes stop_codon:yes gene_type:complete
MPKNTQGSCWPGYHRVSGTKKGTKGSCAKNKFNMRTRKRKRKTKRKTKRRITKGSCRPTGNKRSAKIVNGKCIRFGYKPMPIKANNPKRRKSFCARHKCSQKRDKATAGYQSCVAWKCKMGK